MVERRREVVGKEWVDVWRRKERGVDHPGTDVSTIFLFLPTKKQPGSLGSYRRA